MLKLNNKFDIIRKEGKILYEIEFYEDESGYSEIVIFIKELQRKSKGSKESRINFNKIVAYMDLLSEMGTRVGEPVTKHVEGDIWELRPLKHRFLYAYYENEKYVILHHFVKKTKKTPKRELEHAKRKLKDWMERKWKNDNMEKC